MKTQIRCTRVKITNSMNEIFTRWRSILVDLGGSHVAVWALLGCNFCFGLYLMIARENLFGAPVGAGEVPWPLIRFLWNKFAGSSDVLLISLALALLLGLRFRFVEIIWWAAAFSASVWITVWLLATLAYTMDYAALQSISLTGIIPMGLSVFACLRVSADSSDLVCGQRFRRSSEREGADDAK